MTLVLRYGNYDFDITPKISKTIKPTESGPMPSGEIVSWTMEGELYNPSSMGADNIATMRRTLTTALLQVGVDLVLYNTSSGSNVDILRDSDAAGGLYVETFDIPTDDGTGYAVSLPFKITIAGIFNHAVNWADDDTNVFGEYTIDNSQDNTSLVYRIRGKLYGSSETYVRNKVNLIIASISDRMLLIRKSLTSSHAAMDDAGTNGKTRPQYEFSVEVCDLNNSPEVYEVSETIEVQKSYMRTIARPMLGGIIPVLQTTALQPAMITQSGTATGRTGYPRFPSQISGNRGNTGLYEYPAPRLRYPDAESPHEIKLPPRQLPDGSCTEYKIQWRYTMVAQYWTGDVPNPMLPVGAAS